jgi:hypothetical protein
VVDADVRAAAAAVLGESESTFPCDECDFVASSRRGLAQHKRSHAAPQRASREPARVAPSDLLVEEVVGKTVANLQVVGGYLSIVLPHTGLAIAGVPGERPGDPPIVQSRAVLAGTVLGQWARRDDRVLQALARFNRLFETSEVVELAVGLSAAVAVDVGAVPADLAVEVGPFVGDRAIQPVRAVIGDVVDYVRTLQPPPPEPNGRRVEPDQEWRDAAPGAAPAREMPGTTVIDGSVEDT